MKKPYIVLFLLLSLTTFAQEVSRKDVPELLKTSDFSRIFMCEEFIDDPYEERKFKRMEPLGYFGDDYQRIFIHFMSVIKNNDNPKEYFVHGKSKLKGNICDFQGSIIIEHVWEYTNDKELPDFRRGEITGTYTFHEDQKQKGTGKYTGKFSSSWYLNKKGEVEYDAFTFVADGYTNNEFKGQWISHKSGITKKCNWGDYRIPDSRGLDIGAGEFSPDEKYYDKGWESYSNQWNPDSDPRAIEARKVENQKWWKER